MFYVRHYRWRTITCNNFITTIFGEENAVETSSFEEGVQELTAIMTKTYKQQRLQFKWDQKRAKLFTNTDEINL